MTDTIKNDMYGKIKRAKEIAAKALGQVDLGAKVLKPEAPAKAKLDVQTKTSKNATSESAESGKAEIKGKLLAKLKLKKADAKTEVPVTKSKLVEESAPAGTTEVKKVPDDKTKAQKAKVLAKAKKADAKETKVKG
jgi:hypothetical protein